MEDLLLVVLLIAVFGMMTWFTIWLAFLLPSKMAKARNRDPVAWVLVSLLGSAFLAIFLLWFLGEARE